MQSSAQLAHQFESEKLSSQQTACSAKAGQLSPRESQILARLAEGDSYKEISARLGITVQTVNDHIKNLYRKLEVHSRAHAVVRYLQSAASK